MPTQFRFRAATLLTSIAAALVFASAATAAPDNSWTQPQQGLPNYVSNAGASSLQVAWVDNAGCKNQGQVVVRFRASRKWTTPEAASSCMGASLGQPSVARDPDGSVFVVWEQTDDTHPTVAGIYYSSANGIGGFGHPRRLVSLPTSQITTAPVVAAARGRRLWVMWERPMSILDTSPAFLVEAFDESDGLSSAGNLAVGEPGVFHADNAPSDIKIYAGNLGVLVFWRLTDAGGRSAWYAADTLPLRNDPTRAQLDGLRLTFRGQIGLASGTTLFIGEDNRPYKIVETQVATNALGQSQPETIDVFRWSWVSHRFYPAAGGAVSFAHLQSAGSQFVAAQVDPQRDVYLAFQDWTGATSTQCSLQLTFQPCVRSSGAATIPPVIRVVKITLAGVQTEASVPWAQLFSPPPGSQTINWEVGQTGLEQVTTAFGGVRVVYVNSEQVVSSDGSVANQGSAAVFSNPLTFGPRLPVNQ